MKKILKIILIIFLILMLTNFTFAFLSQGEIKIFAVTEDERGMTAQLNTTISKGTGQVAFFTSNSLVGKDTQTTGNIALKIAQEKSQTSLGNNNLTYDIRANASEVDGPSAGAAMALLVYSMLSEKELNSKVAITGTINNDGSIGAVGGVGPKAQKAADVGIELFLIPAGQSITYILDEQGKNKSVNLLEYGPKELGIKILEVATIDEVIKYAYSNINEIEIDVEKSQSTFIPKSIAYQNALEPMKKISQEYINRAKDEIKEAEKQLELTDLDEIIRVSFYAQLGEAKRDVELSQIYYDQNYLYSAANYSFNAHVVAGTIKKIAQSPSLLFQSSKILNLKVLDLKKEIKDLKDKMDFLTLDKIEWLISSQQRIAYAENALKGIDENFEFKTEEEEKLVQITKVRSLVSAEEWVEVAKDFFKEAQTSNQLKKVKYLDKTILEAQSKIEQTEELLEDKNLTQTTILEAQRRLASAKISFDNNFYYSSLMDSGFAQAFINSEKEKNKLSPLEIEQKVIQKERELEGKLESVWANIFFDHAKFFIENSKFENELGRGAVKQTMQSTAHDLIFLSNKINQITKKINDELLNLNLETYVKAKNNSNEIIKDQLNQNQKIANTEIYLELLLLLILLLLLVVMMHHIKVRKIDSHHKFKRADKIHYLLNRLDKALNTKKITQAEYFLLKKKYEDELKQAKHKTERQKVKLTLEETKAKLLALKKGLKDLNKHYKAGLVIPEDYEKHLKEVNEEIKETQEEIEKLKQKKHHNRRLLNKKTHKIEKKIKGTEDLAIIEQEEEKKEIKERKKLLQKFRNKKNN
jgi:uncharacterized protein